MENRIYLTDEYDRFWKKIENKENFALLRHGDGERSIILGKKIHAQEGWKSPDRVTKLGIDCMKALTYEAENYFVAISCPCCDRAAYYWYVSHIPHSNLTFANLWVNKNYSRFYEDFFNLKRDAIIIANNEGRNKPIGNLNILKFYSVGDDCVNFWENESNQFIHRIIDDFGSRNDLLYVISAGPMAGPIIKRLYENNPNNSYIDFGSAIDEFVHNRKTRPYMLSGTVYAKCNCWMYSTDRVSFDVTCVCNMYKRPESLVKQVQALEEQTLRPKEIILYQDGIADSGYKIELLDSLKKKFANIKIASENTGVWERFRFAKDTANSHYVCVFDDDTIPGQRWLENCHAQIMKQEGIYGTNGIIMKDTKNYPYKRFVNVGWHNPVTKTTQVDFVGHSWFFPKKCLDYMFEDTEDFQTLKYVGEDMCISVKAKEHGIMTYIPPHPPADISFWGSIPAYGWRFGQSAEALSLNKGNLEKMKNAVELFIKNGWKPICLEDKTLVHLAVSRIRKGKVIWFYCRLKTFAKSLFRKGARQK